MLLGQLEAAQMNAAAESAPLYRFLLLLVEERVPINHTWTIANVLAVPRTAPGKKQGKVTDSQDERLRLAEQVRIELRENSARYYLEQYWEAGSRYLEVGKETKAELDKLAGDPEALHRLEARIRRALADANGAASILVAPHEYRWALWTITEGLFLRKELNRPVLVLKPSELTETMRALDSSKVVI
jgi:flagellar biosynthesis component FlhA